MSDDVTIPREVLIARDLRSHASVNRTGLPMAAAVMDAAADVLDPPVPPLTLAQEATVEWLVAEGRRGRVTATRELLAGEWPTRFRWNAAALDFAARDPLRLLAEHGTPLTEEPPEGTLLLVVPRGGGTPWVAWMGFSSWVYLNANGTVYRLGGAS